jgi:hypothetical protein
MPQSNTPRSFVNRIVSPALRLASSMSLAAAFHASRATHGLLPLT